MFRPEKKQFPEFQRISPEILVAMPYEFSGEPIEIIIDTKEFTCLCPWTGQPDFAHLIIKYVPDKKCVELKSLKLYLQSFRNVGIVHESAVNRIMQELKKLIKPKKMLVRLSFNVRGGLTTEVVAGYRYKENV